MFSLHYYLLAEHVVTLVSSPHATLSHFSLSHICPLCVAVVAGPPPSSSVPDDISDDVTLPSDQSSKSRGEDKSPRVLMTITGQIQHVQWNTIFY